MSTRQRLVSWKRIAQYLDRGERTVRRWAAQEGMPVHRVAGGKHGSVFAYPEELTEWLHRDQSPADFSPADTSILVLPFKALGGEVPAVAEALLNDVISALSRLPDLRVIARTTTAQAEAMQGSNFAVAKTLAVDFFIQGSLAASNKGMEISVALCQTDTGVVAWRDSWRVGTTAINTVPAQAAARCAGAVAAHVLQKDVPKTEAAVLAGDPNDDYLQGRYLLNRMTPESLRKSVSAFDRVIAAVPDFAPAYASKVEALQLLTNFAPIPPTEVMPDAILALNKAIALDPDSAEVFASLGYLHSTYTYDWPAAESAFIRALSLNANLVQAHQWYAEMLANLGRFDDGLVAIDAAKRIDPLNLAVEVSRGHVLWLARRFGELIPAMQRVIETEADFPLPHILLFCGYFEQGLYDDSVRVAERAIKSMQMPAELMVFDALGRAMRDDPAAIEQIILGLEAIAKDSYVPSFPFAILNTYRSDYAAAVDYLNRAADEKLWHVTMAGQAAIFDPLRGFPPFEAFLNRIGLAESAYQPAP